jgi:hypothetical protein
MRQSIAVYRSVFDDCPRARFAIRCFETRSQELGHVLDKTAAKMRHGLLSVPVARPGAEHQRVRICPLGLFSPVPVQCDCRRCQRNLASPRGGLGRAECTFVHRFAHEHTPALLVEVTRGQCCVTRWCEPPRAPFRASRRDALARWQAATGLRAALVCKPSARTDATVSGIRTHVRARPC